MSDPQHTQDSPTPHERHESAPPAPRPAPPGAPVSTGETGDLLIDAALRDLEQADPQDLDAQIEAGQQVHRALQTRLSDLGGQ